ncbi:MAG: LamG-like jellyroll fold domain-containing protein [Gelidibacter sp.]
MKKYYTYYLKFILTLFITGVSFGQSGIFESYLIINTNNSGNAYYDLQAVTGNPDFNGNLGTFASSNSSQTLILNGAQNKTYKCGSDNILNGWLDYRIYKQGDTPPSFSSTQISFNSDIGGAGPGCQNQLWESNGSNIDILNGLSSGNYYLEVFTHADYDINNDNNLDGTIYANNSGANYKSSFRIDNPPTANCLGTLNVVLDASGNANITAADIDNGSTDDFDTPTLSIDITTFDCSDVGTPVTVTLTAEDSLGQTDTCVTSVTVVDTSAPVITCPADITIACDANTLPANTGTASAVDACDATPTITYADAVSGINGNNRTITRTWTATDVNGNSATCNQIITIQDTSAPVITCPADVITTNDAGQCFASSVVIGAPTATDNCSTNLTYTGTRDDSLALTANYPTGVTTITWTATDENGNISNPCTQTITVNDTENPTIICPTDVIVNADANCEATSVALGSPTVSDNCGVASVTNNLGALLPLPTGTFDVTWTVTDTSGHTATCIQQVTVEDHSIPTITCPTPAASYNADAGTCGKILSFNATASDNCGNPTLSYSIGGTPITFPYNFSVGSTTVLVTATAGNGQTATCDFDVVVNDTQVPTITCPATINVPATAAGCTAIVNLTTPATADNCGIASVTNNHPSTSYSIGNTTVIWTVTDIHGNTATCNQTVTVTDPAAASSASISASLTSPICLGTSVTFTGTTTNAGSNPQYQWFIGATAVPGETNATFTTTALAVGSNTVRLRLTSGPCNTVKFSNSIVMVVNPNLPVSFTLNGPNTICAGDTANFYITNAQNFGTNPSYVWKVNGASTGVTASSYSTTILTNGQTVSVEVTSNATCATPVPQTQSIVMTVNALPTVAALANGNNVNTFSICQGLPLTLTGNGASTYTWDNGVTNGVAFTPTVGTHTYTVTGTNANGCKNTDSIIVTVTPNPTITLTTNNNNQEICGPNPNQSIANIKYNITNANTVTVSGLPAGVTYNFTGGVLTISGNPTSNTLNTYNYTVTATNSVCGTPGVTATGSIKVYNGPPSTPSSIQGITVICPVTTTTYTVNNDLNVQFYEWDLPTGFTILSGNGTNSITVQIDNNFDPPWNIGTIRVRATNPCGTSNWKSKYVFKNPFQSIGLNAGSDEIICQDDSIDLSGTVFDQQIILDNNLTFSWSDNGAGGTFSNYSNNNLNVTYTPPTVSTITNINISLIAHFPSFLCGGNDVSDQMILTVRPDLPASTIGISGSDVICNLAGNSATITITGTPNTEVLYSANGNNNVDDISNTWLDLGATGVATITVSAPLSSSQITYTIKKNRYNSPPKCVSNQTNQSVTVYLNQPPTVFNYPNQTICSDGTVTLTDSGTGNNTFGGTNASGTWSTTGDGSFAPANSKNSVYTPGPNDIFNGTATLTFTNNPTDGVCGAASDSMVITIKEKPAIGTQPQNLTACEGETVSFSVGATGDDLSYQWYHGTTAVGTNNPNLTLTGVTAANAGTYYVVVSGNSNCATPATSNVVTLSVNKIEITNNPIDASVCAGSNATFSVNATGTGLSYQWYYNGNPMSGEINETLNLTNVSVTNAGNYNVVVSGDYCSAVSSTTAVLTVTEQPIVTINYTQAAYCPSDSAQTVILTGSNTAGGTYASTPAGLAINTNTGTITPSSSAAGTYTVTYTVAATGGCAIATDNTTVTIYGMNPAAIIAGGNIVTPNCGVVAVPVSANAPSVSGATGIWTASPTTSGFFDDATQANATFTGESGTTYTLTWTITNPGGCSTSSDTITVTFTDCGTKLYFDGIDDHVNFNNTYNLGANFSIETWVKRNNNSATQQSILSKRNGNSTATGYDLSIINNRVAFRWNGNSITSSQTLNASRWYHIAVTYSNTTYKLYVDGVLSNTVTTNATIPNNNTDNFLMGATARPNNTPINYYEGFIDELRIWSTTLTTEQIRLMMNQEIENNGGAVVGSVTGALVSTSLNWTNLTGYYQMNLANGDIANGHLLANVGGIDGNLNNMTNQQDETAPLPYVSTQNGNWDTASTWLNGAVQMTPNTNGVDWNIVKTQNDISTNRPTTVLGLVVDSNRLSVINDQPLYVNKYLKINGTLDLVGESQLLQPMGSFVDNNGIGNLERDQQGTSNLYSYNYWGSPVNTGANSYTVGGILRNGTNANNIQPIQWTNGTDANFSTNPITMSSRWIYAFSEGAEANYSDWFFKGNVGSFNVGLGFTMKGSGAASTTQNYTFVGRPNNGTINSNTVTASVSGLNQTLVGNPYPSAIDAKEFIKDNILGGNPGTTASIDGTLYYWEQYTTNNTHLLTDYQGSYAAYNLSGSLGSVTPPEISNQGSSAKTPKQFIPVAQGFFVTAAAVGDQVTPNIQFKNSQRAFVKETSGNSQFFRNANQYNNSTDGEGDSIVDSIQRVRLAFTTPEGAKRPLLLAFTPDNAATDGFDYGYDAKNTDDLPNDMSLMIANDKYIIEGVGAFDVSKQYPIGIFLSTAGTVNIELTDLENFDSPIDVYVYDALLGTYTQINDLSFQMQLEAGDYVNRFSIVFETDDTLSTIDETFKDITVNYLQRTDEIYVKMPESIYVKQVYLINTAGQTVKSWNVTNMNFGSEFKIPVKQISEGNYILSVQTNTQTYNKKVIVKY